MDDIVGRMSLYLICVINEIDCNESDRCADCEIEPLALLRTRGGIRRVHRMITIILIQHVVSSVQ